MSEQDIIKLKTDCELYKNKIDKLEHTVEVLQDRVNRLEAKGEKTDFQYEQIMETLKKLTDTTIPNLSKEIQSLKEKPVERYNSVVGTIITSVVATIIGYVLGRIFK